MRIRTNNERWWGAIVAALLASVVAAGPASAGTMKHWVCLSPSGEPTKNIAGWVASNRGVAGGNAYSSCGTRAGGGLISDMTAVTNALDNGKGIIYTYTAPPGTSISTANLKFNGYVTGPDQAASMGIVLYRGSERYDGNGVIDQCQYFAGCSTYTPEGNYEVGADAFIAFLGCGTGTPGATCGPGNRGSLAIQRGAMNLVDSAPPTVSNPGGTVMQDLPLRGTETLTFSAADVGVGVSDVEVKLGDAVLVRRQLLDVNDGKCIPVDGGYAWPVPCKASVAASLSIDTTKVADGPQTLTATVWDAAGNPVSAISRRVNVANAAGSGSTPTAPTINDLVSDNGQGGDPSTGTLVPSRKRERTRVGHGETVRVQGHVRDAAGRPIVNAQVDVYEQVSVKGATPQLVGSVTSDDKGGYAYKAKPRSSRLVELRYSRQRGATIYQSTHALDVSVRASITLRADRASIPSYGKVTLRGRVVLDHLPKGGALLQIRARDGKRWLKVGTPRTDPSGKFSWTWKFRKVRRGAVVFQARLLQTGDVPGVANNSRSVRIRIG